MCLLALLTLFPTDLRHHQFQLLSMRVTFAYPQQGMNASAPRPRAVHHRVIRTDQGWTAVSLNLRQTLDPIVVASRHMITYKAWHPEV